MKSGLEDRNNTATRQQPCRRKFLVSMKSGLEDRNNWRDPTTPTRTLTSQ